MTDNPDPKLVTKASNYEKNYRKYIEEVGVEHSCSVIRNHGEDISLMVEIVMFNQRINLFPADEFS